jgi:hypothetical protein
MRKLRRALDRDEHEIETEDPSTDMEHP